ncbi:MAG: DUF502 domain-containing protein [Desulfuromonadales bacterium]|nr:DUF502 domain-containing protein [Desulfuromonadales bacterium]
MLARIGKTMFQGLLAILPAVLTLYILYWLVWSAENILGVALKVLLPQGWYIPGMGLLTGLVAVFLFGLFLNAFLGRKLFAWSEAAMNRIPLVKTLYGSVKDFIGFFAQKREQQFNQVVTVTLEIGGVPMRLLGFVTRNDFSDLPPGIGKEGELAVYLPLSYQIGGYTVIVPRSAVTPINISMHRAMGFAVTGGMFSDKAGGRPHP